MDKFEENLIYQIREVRENATNLLERSFKRVLKNSNLPNYDRLQKSMHLSRELYYEFITNIAPEVDENWKKIFKKAYDNSIILAYYRRDSFLVADAPILQIPVMAIVPTDGSITTYFGCNEETLFDLVKTGYVLLEADAPWKYHTSKNIRLLTDFVKKGYNFVYMNALEDALVTHFLENEKNIMGITIDEWKNLSDRKHINNIKENFNLKEIRKFLPAEDFQNLENLLVGSSNSQPKLPDRVIDIPGGLRINPKQKFVERYLNLFLIDYFNYTAESNTNDKIIIENGLSSQFLNYIARRRNKLTKSMAVYSFWHVIGAPIFMGEGLYTLSSSRDLKTVSSVNPNFSLKDITEKLKLKIEMINVGFLTLKKEIYDICKKTKIDDKTLDRGPIIEDRSKLIGEILKNVDNDTLINFERLHKYYAENDIEKIRDEFLRLDLDIIDKGEPLESHLKKSIIGGVVMNLIVMLIENLLSNVEIGSVGAIVRMGAMGAETFYPLYKIVDLYSRSIRFPYRESNTPLSHTFAIQLPYRRKIHRGKGYEFSIIQKIGIFKGENV